MGNSIEQIVQRPQGYLFQDGLVELGAGALFVMNAALLAALDRASDSHILAVGLGLLGPPLLVGVTLLVKRGIQAGKRAFTFRHTGYVRVTSELPTRLRWVIMAGASVLFLASFVLPADLRKAAFALGGLLSLILAAFGARSGLYRFYLLALITFGASLLINFTVDSEARSAVYVSAAAGFLLMASGIVVFLRYWRRVQGSRPAGDG